MAGLVFGGLPLVTVTALPAISALHPSALHGGGQCTPSRPRPPLDISRFPV
ncbi:MAG: hypothetical protein IKD46_09200 [Lentisphaeria bacterium]|nr:hypothetical protein [Lentisphaeria bacterium]